MISKGILVLDQRIHPI